MNRQNEAKGIYVRNKLAEKDFKNSAVSPKAAQVGRDICAWKYDKEKDWKPINDLFEPVSHPPKDYHRMPLEAQIEFISKDKQLKALETLIDQKYVGVDAEWRPQMHRWQEAKGPALLQVAGQNEAFIIDVIGLSKNKKLDDLLCKIFSNPKTYIIGAGFSSDVSQFAKYLPHMRFIKQISNLIDIQDVYKRKYPDFKENGGFGLAAISERVTKKKICKKEQISNWERRPLRYSQEHYASMDAFILPILLKKILSGKDVNQDKDCKGLVKSIGTKPPAEQEEKKNSKRDKKEKDVKEGADNGYTNSGTANYDEKPSLGKKKVKKEKNADLHQVPENQVADPAMIGEYEIKIEYHKKMVAHFEGLKAKAEKLNNNKQ